jgi:hypothetical protein
MKLTQLMLAAGLSVACAIAAAKIPPLPPAPPEDPKVAAEKAEKAKTAAEQAKALQVAAEERAVKNFQLNMKKAGKPIPKPTLIAAATPPQLMPGPAGGKATPTPGGSKAPTAAASAKGHEKGAMTPSGNTPPKGNETPMDAKEADRKGKR